MSYFEQVQNNTNYYRSEKEVGEKLEAIMRPSAQAVIQTAQKHHTSLRMAAYIVALDRVLLAIKLSK